MKVISFNFIVASLNELRVEHKVLIKVKISSGTYLISIAFLLTLNVKLVLSADNVKELITKLVIFPSLFNNFSFNLI